MKYDILHDFYTPVDYQAKCLDPIRTIIAVKPLYKNLQSTLLTTSRCGILTLMGQNWEEKGLSKSLLVEYTVVYEKLSNIYPLRNFQILEKIPKF